MRKQTRILTKADSNLWTVDEVRYLPGLDLRRHWQETITGDTVTPQDPTEELHVITTQAGRTSIRLLHWKTGKPDSIDNDQARWQMSDNFYALELDAQGQTISREEYYPFGGTAVWAARSELEANARVVPENSWWTYLQHLCERWNPLADNPSNSTNKPNEINNETRAIIKDYMENDSKKTIKTLKDALEKMHQAAAALNENSFRNIKEEPYAPKNATACVGTNEHNLHDTSKDIKILINYEDTGKRHLYNIATIIIHEMTHLVLKTKDYCNSQTVPFPGKFDGKSTKKLRQYASQTNSTPLTGADNIANLISLLYYSQACDEQTKSLYTRHKQSLSKSGWREALLDFGGTMPEVSWPRVSSAEIQRRVLPVNSRSSRIKPASAH